MDRACHGTPRLTDDPTNSIFKVPPFLGVAVTCLETMGLELAEDEATAEGTEVVLAGLTDAAGGAVAAPVGDTVDVLVQPMANRDNMSMISGIINFFILFLISIFLSLIHLEIGDIYNIRQFYDLRSFSPCHRNNSEVMSRI
jgi:hypothetical protein